MSHNWRQKVGINGWHSKRDVNNRVSTIYHFLFHCNLGIFCFYFIQLTWFFLFCFCQFSVVVFCYDFPMVRNFFWKNRAKSLITKEYCTHEIHFWRNSQRNFIVIPNFKCFFLRKCTFYLIKLSFLVVFFYFVEMLRSLSFFIGYCK